MQKLGSQQRALGDRFSDRTQSEGSIDNSCTNSVFIGVLCENSHRSSFPTRCRKCGNCVKQYRRVLYAKFFFKLKEYKLLNSGNSPKFYFWTLGTSFLDTDVSIKQLRVYWKLFRHRMKNFTKNNSAWYCVSDDEKKIKSVNFVWKGLFYVIEKGSVGGRLHFHILVNGYSAHNVVVYHWRDIIGEKSNVNFTKKKDYMTNERALNYMLKYITKDAGRYYWLGDFWKIKFEKYDKEVRSCEFCVSLNLIYTWNIQQTERVSDLLPIIRSRYSSLQPYWDGYIQLSILDYYDHDRIYLGYTQYYLEDFI